MTVKEVFELRKQGRIEEAYDAIRPMYAAHHGKYTSLCMFWTASDILKKRVKEQRHDEAEKIFKALLRLLPNIEDRDGRAHSNMLYAALMLDRQDVSFSMLDFVARLKVELLRDDDWKSITPLPPTTGERTAHTIPPVAKQLLTRAFCEIQEAPTVDNALMVMPLLQEAMRRQPDDTDNLRHMATIYRIMGEHDKADAIDRQTGNSRDSNASHQIASHTVTGSWGEEVAMDFLRQHGYTILQHDWHSGHRDIDIIACHQNTIIFVEVKTRSNTEYGTPEQAVGYWKRKNLRNAMNHYVKQNHINTPIRFDIITVIGKPGDTSPVVNHIKDINILE